MRPAEPSALKRRQFRADTAKVEFTGLDWGNIAKYGAGAAAVILLISRLLLGR